MFIGHFGVALAAKRVKNAPSLGTLFLAAQFLDLLWPILLLTGTEKVVILRDHPTLTELDFASYPYSHSLLFALIWSVVIAGVYFFFSRKSRIALLLAALVFSHWVLDYVTHVPDLQIVPWSAQRVGLGLWNHPAAAITVESLIFAAGIAVYLSCTRAKGWLGHLSFWSLMILLAGFYASNFYSPPPPDAEALGAFALLVWVLVAWGYWIDLTREKILS